MKTHVRSVYIKFISNVCFKLLTKLLLYICRDKRFALCKCHVCISRHWMQQRCTCCKT